MLRQISLVQKLTFGFALGPAILAVIGWVAYSNTAALQRTATAVTQSYRILEATASLLARLNEAESGQRGYLLLGDEAYLAPYKDALPAIERELASLMTLTADIPRHQARLQEARPLVARRLEVIAETLRTRKESGVDAAAAIVREGIGPPLMRQIRALLREIDREETERLAERESETKRTSQVTFDLIIYGSLASFVLLALSGYVLTRDITVPVRHAIQALASSTAEIVAGTSQQAAGAQEQAAAVAQTMSTVDEIAQTASQAKERATAVSDASRRALEVGNAGRRAVEDTIAVMTSVREQSELIARTILDLAEQAQAIGDIIEAVNDIAEQTNLLALNAAIEASHAGEHGKGFGVVAQEIKSLADQSKKATSQVRQILGEIQRATNNAVMSTEQGSRSVSEAMRTADQAGSTIRTLADTIGEAAQVAAQIVASVGQQAIGMSQIQQAMHSISTATNQNLASTRQAERAAQDLEALGSQLRGMLIGAAA